MVSVISALKASVNTVGIREFLLFAALGILAYFAITFLQDKFSKYGMLLLVKESLASFRGTR